MLAAYEQTPASSNRLKLRGKTKKDKKKGWWAQTLPSLVWFSSLGNLEGRTCLWRSFFFLFLCVCVFCFVLMLLHYQLLTLAEKQGACNVIHPWLYPRHGNPCGLQWRPGLHVGSVSWLGDKFPACAPEGGNFHCILRRGRRCDKRTHVWRWPQKKKRCLNKLYQHLNSICNYLCTVTCLLLFLTPCGFVRVRMNNLSTTFRLLFIEISWSFSNKVKL